jgi:hypothetical protein
MCPHVGQLTAGGHVAIRPRMGGKCGLPDWSRSGKAPRGFDSRSLHSESRALTVTPRGQLSLLGATGPKLPESVGKRAGGPGGRAGSSARCDFEAPALVVALARSLLRRRLIHQVAGPLVALWFRRSTPYPSGRRAPRRPVARASDESQSFGPTGQPGAGAPEP